MTPEKSIVSIIDKEAEDFLIPAYFVSMPTIEDEKRDFEELKSIYIAGRSKSIESEKAKDERIKELEKELKKYSSNEICSECGQPDGKHRKRCSEYYRYMMDNDPDLGAQS